MKLTNISLAILVAIGLVACGGSDNKNNPVPDPEPKPIPGNDNPPPPPKDESGLAPTRVAPDLTVNKSYEAIVNSRKRVFIDRGFVDNALGYSGAKGDQYDPTVGTNPANIKLASTYNFLQVGDVLTDSAIAREIANGNTAYVDESVGAIYVGEDPKNVAKSRAFVKVGDLYYRVKADPSKNPGTDKTKYLPSTPFIAEDASIKKEFSQSQVVFVANTLDDAGKAKATTAFELGDINGADGTTAVLDPAKGEVKLTRIKVFGKEYDASLTGENLDFGQLDPMREIQTEDVTGTFSISNNKLTGNGIDDKTINRSITLGKIKAYNLPYSIALVTTNVDEDLPIAKNIFNLQVAAGTPAGNAAYQVRGYETPSLPREGRAHYYGKSFNASVTGDVELIADFAADRTGISGTIFNRKDHTGTQLPTLSLEKIPLTGPTQHNTNSTAGVVTGQPAYADKWSVTIYGPEAEEAAGTIMKGTAIKEVYNTQREKLTNKSNDPDVK